MQIPIASSSSSSSSSASSSSWCSSRQLLLLRHKIPNQSSFSATRSSSCPPSLLSFPINSPSSYHSRRPRLKIGLAAAAKTTPGHASKKSAYPSKHGEGKNSKVAEEQDERDNIEVEVEEDLPWIQEKALDLVEFTGSVTQAIPGPRVGQSSLPWILTLPLAYAGFTFVVAFVKTVKKFSSPKHKRRMLV